ncbi:XrtA/PEP-CTERM system TPR-repeat protein PrsT [Glaciecola sp. SC05]|uniref:XrtA/PEP-CTERM system TPR-repeat protein PrsT n=1 Tax=Glaciecola sp. SC05 TaxID=1987355 RepID=UPI00352967EC
MMLGKKLSVLIVLVTLFLSACSRQSPEELLASAKVNIANGDLTAAVIELKNIVSQDFTSVEPRVLLGQVYLKLSDFDASEKELRRALDMGAAGKDVYPYLARTLYYQEDFQGVIDLSSLSGVSLDSQVQESIALLSYLSAVRLNQSEAASVEVPEFDSEYKASLASAYLAFVTNAPEQADLLLSELAVEEEHRAEQLFLQGLVKNRLQQLKEAAQGYEQLLAIYPNYHLVRLLLIDIQVRDREIDAANDNINLLLQINANQAAVNFYKGAVEFLNENYETSFIHAVKAKEGDFNDFRNDIVLGLSALKMGNLEQSYGALARAATVLPKTHSIHRLLAKIQLDLGYRTDAMQSLRSFQGESELDAILFETAATLFALEQDYVSASQQMDIANQLSGEASANQLLRQGLIRIAANDFGGIAQIEQSIEMQPEVVQKWLLLADVYMGQNEFDKAMVLAKQLAEQDQVSGLVLEGQILGRMGEAEQAAAKFEQALQLDESNIAALNNLIRSYKASNQTEKARQTAYTALTQNPENKTAAAELIQIASASGFEQRDFTFISELQQNNSQLETPKIILATWYREKGETKAAIDILTQNVNSLTNTGLMALGDTYYNEGMLSEAAGAYERWKAAYPQDIQPIMRLVAVYAQQGNQQKLRLFLDNAIQQFPNAEPLRLARLQNLISTSSFGEAQREFNMLIQAGSTNIILEKFKGQIALAANQPALAVESFEKFYAVSRNLENAVNLARAYARNKQTTNARDMLVKFVDEVDRQPSTMAVVAEYMLTQGFYSDAARYYEAILKIDASSLIANNNLAMAYLGDNKPAEALKAAEAAANLAPSSPQIMDTYGWALFKNGKTNEAQSMLALAHQKLPNDAAIAMHYAEVLLSLNNTNMAIRVLSSVNTNNKAQQTQLDALIQAANQG